MKDCVLCGRRCRVNRIRSVRGAACRTSETPIVASCGIERKSSDPISGEPGSGTISFSWSNMRCVYSENWESRLNGVGQAMPCENLAQAMISLQADGCRNINLVNPSHVIPHILEALSLAADQGLRLPIIFNTSGFDSPEALDLLDGVVDVYVAEMRFGDSRAGRQYCGVRNYASVNRTSVKHMHRQVGELHMDNGFAQRGLLIRHVVLPGGLAGTGRVLKFISEEISPDTYVRLVDNYRPAHRAFDAPPLDRTVQPAEFRRALKLAEKYGLTRLAGRAA